MRKLAYVLAIAMGAILVAAVAFDSPTADRAAPKSTTAVIATMPIVPAEVRPSGDFGFGPARTTDW